MDLDPIEGQREVVEIRREESKVRKSHEKTLREEREL